MSFEKPNKDQYSEDIEKQFPIFRTNEGSDPTEEVLPSLEHISELQKNYEALTITDFHKKYNEKIKVLHDELSKIDNYLKAKAEQPLIASKLADMYAHPPYSGVTLAEQNSILQRYDAVIATYEQNGVPEELLIEARKKSSDLKDMIEEITKIQHVAKVSPENN